MSFLAKLIFGALVLVCLSVAIVFLTLRKPQNESTDTWAATRYSLVTHWCERYPELKPQAREFMADGVLSKDEYEILDDRHGALNDEKLLRSNRAALIKLLQGQTWIGTSTNQEAEVTQ